MTMIPAAAAAAGCTAARFPGIAASAGLARDFIRGVLGPGHPAADNAELCATELVANAIAYTRSGLPGGMVTVGVRVAGAAVVITVTDQGSPDAPLMTDQAAPTAPAALAEHGYGLRLVDALADDWGTAPDPAGRAVWFRCGGDR